MEDNNYIRTIALQIKSKTDPPTLPFNGIDDLFDIYAVLALSKGTDVADEDVHNAWSAWTTKYDPSNESLIPFDQLSDRAKSKDRRFTLAIREVAQSLT